MKHLERARRLLRVLEDRASRCRRNEIVWRDRPVQDDHSRERTAANRSDAEDAEFLQELLREYTAKWEPK